MFAGMAEFATPAKSLMGVWDSALSRTPMCGGGEIVHGTAKPLNLKRFGPGGAIFVSSAYTDSPAPMWCLISVGIRWPQPLGALAGAVGSPTLPPSLFRAFYSILMSDERSRY